MTLKIIIIIIIIRCFLFIPRHDITYLYIVSRIAAIYILKCMTNTETLMNPNNNNNK